MLVRSEHYSDYNIRTFNVKRVSIDVKLPWFQIQTHCLVSWWLCTELLFCSVFFRKVKKRREKLNSFTLLCGQIMEYLNIQLPCWPFEDESELITRLMLDLPLCTAGMMSASLRLFLTVCLSVGLSVCKSVHPFVHLDFNDVLSSLHSVFLYLSIWRLAHHCLSS